MRGKPAEKLRPGTAQSVAEVLRDHVVLELEGIDRMYLNVYVPVLQAVEGVLKFIRIHRGHPVASTAMVEPITRRFVESIERYVHDHDIPMITFLKGQRKDEIANQRRAAYSGRRRRLRWQSAREVHRISHREAAQPANPQNLRLDREIDGAGQSLLFLLCGSRLRAVLF